MSEKEKKLVDLVAQLPDSAQKEFLSQVKGAVSALDAIGALQKDQQEKKEACDDGP